MTEPRRIEELLADRATQGLDLAETRELEALLVANPQVDEDGYDLSAAAIHLALTRNIEPMPERVRLAVLAHSSEALPPDLAPPAPLAAVADLTAERSRRQPAAPERGSSPAPWLVAAAALILAVAGWWPRTATDGGEAIATLPPIDAIDSAPDAIRWSWSGTEDPAVEEAGGEVVWSGAQQRGFMRIQGLQANDPSVEQYQLWIFDRAQDERYPVDGGVFDVSADGDVLVPIQAKIGVDEPYLFAVTVEKPGGVVVSSRERIVLLAKA